MQFYFEHIYVIEGLQPICIHVTAEYCIENDHQQYLWPVRIIAKGRLSNCDNETEEQHFMPMNDLAYFLTIGILTGLFCAASCAFHFVRLMTFFKLGKVASYASYLCLHANTYCIAGNTDVEFNLTV